MIKIIFNNKTTSRINRKWLRKIIQKVFAIEKEDKNYALEINFIGQAQMAKLNKKFRNKNYPSTILSFVASESIDFVNFPSKYQYLGEIFFCLAEIENEAEKLKISTKKHMTRLMIHGILHLLGHDHGTEKKAVAMENLEDNILEKYLGDA